MDIRPTNSIAVAVPAAFERSVAVGNTSAGMQAVPVATAGAVAQAAEVPSMPALGEAVKNINKTLQDLSQNLEFSVDNDSARTIVKVVDQQSGEVLRQLPSKEVLEIAKALDRLQGLLISQKA